MKKGFTIIELLVVVIVIAILAAIALPNFLEAQIRAKISRARSEGRAIAAAVATYVGDYSSQPDSYPGLTTRLDRLKMFTTPIAYLTKVPEDVFTRKISDEWKPYAIWWPSYLRGVQERGQAKLPPELQNTGDATLLLSRGPDGDFELDPRENKNIDYQVVIYDPTNGTVSNGDIFVRIN